MNIYKLFTLIFTSILITTNSLKPTDQYKDTSIVLRGAKPTDQYKDTGGTVIRNAKPTDQYKETGTVVIRNILMKR